MQRRAFLGLLLGVASAGLVRPVSNTKKANKVPYEGETFVWKIEPLTPNEIRALQIRRLCKYGTPLVLPPGCKITPLNTNPKVQTWTIPYRWIHKA
jgi:hypothetical protein